MVAPRLLALSLAGDMPVSAGVLAPYKALVELCCDADSELGRLAPEYGLRSLRLTEDVRLDTQRSEGIAQDFLRTHSNADAWSALPCTAWCTWQYVNAAKLGKDFCSRLAYRRRKSIHMVGAAERCIKLAQESGGAVHFEWPRRCRG